MAELREVLLKDDSVLFERICFTIDTYDQDESLILVYVSVVCMRSERVFNYLTTRNSNFNVNHEWHKLFSITNVFEKMQHHSCLTPERAQLDVLVLKASLDRDVSFITDLVLDRSIFTPILI